MLKFLLKKEHFNFMGGWWTTKLKAVMSDVLGATGDLSMLFTKDPDATNAAMNMLLNSF
jgi:hypothetical protein